MEWYHWVAVAAGIIGSTGLALHFSKILKLGAPRDFAQQAGDPAKAIKYAYTGAMNPKKKESAFLHLPTYTAGIIYHLGTFLSLCLFIFILFQVEITGLFQVLIPLILIITFLCGGAILLKRVFSKNLRVLSNVDDYIANFLVSFFHLVTALVIYTDRIHILYFMLASVLLIYMPISKLKHLVFFFAARYQLGFFYGWRNVWPPKKISS